MTAVGPPPRGPARDGPGSPPESCHSGFVCLAGRPNAGKSTLLNRLVGRDIAIATPHPQTTRRAIRGVVNGPGFQVVLIDAPGTHRPRTLLGERLNAVASGAWSEADLVCLCLAADQEVGRGDHYLAAELARAARGVLIALTKADAVARDVLAERLDAAARLARDEGLDPIGFVPVSAVTGENVDTLVSVIADALPIGPPFFGQDDVTDQTDSDLVAELIRRAALDGVREELPHSIAVTVEEMGPRPDRSADRPLIDIHATIHVERPSQKGIIIGRRGARLKEVGGAARRDIERLLGMPVFLGLHVRVSKDWQRDPRQLDRLGY